MMESSQSFVLIILGFLFLVGYVAHKIGARTNIPRGTILLLLGLVAGPSVLDVIPHEAAEKFGIATHIALAMVGFLLGQRLGGKHFRKRGRVILWVSLVETLMAAALVFLALRASGWGWMLALLLASMAPASAPVSTIDVVYEGKAKGPLTDTILGVVAIDDVWSVVLFSVALVGVEMMTGQGEPSMGFMAAFREIAGAVVVGGLLGFPMAHITSKLKSEEPVLLMAAGFVFLCAGFAVAFHVSYLLASLVMGVVVASRARHRTRPFRDIGAVSEPFLAIFFLLAGFECEVKMLATLGIVGGIYILARSIGLVVGGTLGAWLAFAPRVVRSRVGWCLFPQAGITLGLALVVHERLPEVGAYILPIVIASAVVFELVGPVFTLWHLRRAGEL